MNGTTAPAHPARGVLPVLGALYLVAYIGFSFFCLTLGTILLTRGVSMGTVALVNLLGLVYAARFLAAPLVDRVRPSRAGRYRGVLISTQLALVAILLALAPLDPVGDLPWVLVLTVLVMLVSMVHDTALAGFTVRLVPPGAYGTANGVQMAAASLSILIGSSGALLLYAHAGWTAALVCLALVYAVPLAVLARVAEPAAPGTPDAPGAPAGDSGFRALLDYLRRPRTRWWALAVIPAFAAGGWLVSGPQSAMLLEAGWPTDRIALVQSVGYGVQTVAALVTGAALTRFGVSRCAPVLAVAGTVGTAALLPPALGHAPLGPTALVLIATGVVYGAKVTLISAVSMRLARPGSAAGDYTLPLCVEGVFITAVNAAGLALAARAGFVWPVLLAVVVAAAALLVPGWLRRNLAPGEDGPEPRAVAGTVPCAGRRAPLRAGRPVSPRHSHRSRRS